MFGASVDTLNMYMEFSHGDLFKVWSLQGEQANVWLSASYSLQTYNPVRLWFEGVVGSSFFGDIAIDDVNLAFGPCPADVSIRNKNANCFWF